MLCAGWCREYGCMHDILLPKEMCSKLRDLFTFWKISDNISEMVQDKDIVAIEKNVKKGKGFPYSLLSVGPGADPGV